MNVGEFCNREVVVMRRDETARDAARIMRQLHVGDVIVVDERQGRRIPVGIVTDRDLTIEILAAAVDPDAVTVGDVMSGELITAREHEDTWDCLQQMRNRGVRRMPVVDGDGALVGIMTVDDYINVFAEQLEDLVRLVTQEQRRERSVRERP